jgi:16S rRNA (guanine(527)-N(7))-methyltransferase RsmG
MIESREGLLRLLTKSGIERESRAAAQMFSYLALLEKWNRRINLTASSGWSHLEPLFEEGIWAARLYPSGAVAHLDIGSGAGFPAVLIGILLPSLQIDLVESRVKKTAFLETVAAELKLAGMRAYTQRLEVYLRQTRKIWDCVTWKGIRLSRDELSLLRSHAHSGTQFWMFHGRDPAVDAPETMDWDFELRRTEKFPARREWMISVYRAR